MPTIVLVVAKMYKLVFRVGKSAINIKLTNNGALRDVDERDGHEDGGHGQLHEEARLEHQPLLVEELLPERCGRIQPGPRSRSRDPRRIFAVRTLTSATQPGHDRVPELALVLPHLVARHHHHELLLHIDRERRGTVPNFFGRRSSPKPNY